MGIRLENVRKSFRDPEGAGVEALAIDSLTVGDGEQVCVVGGSGSGKTTLLNVIAGILKPDPGSVVIVKGVQVPALPESARDRFRARHIGYMFQTFNLLQGYSALENVLLPLHFAGFGASEARQRAKDLLDRMGLAGKTGRRPSHLSVGEQQRTAVARAVACKPAILLADEPTANLDAANAEAALDLLKEEANRAGAALVVVTHDERVRESFDRVVTLEAAR